MFLFLKNVRACDFGATIREKGHAERLAKGEDNDAWITALIL